MAKPDQLHVFLYCNNSICRQMDSYFNFFFYSRVALFILPLHRPECDDDSSGFPSIQGLQQPFQSIKPCTCDQWPRTAQQPSVTWLEVTCARAATFALLGCLHLCASPGFVTFQWSVLGQSCSHLKPEHNDQIEPEFICAREECQVCASPVKREFHNIELRSGRQAVGRIMVVLMYVSPSEFDYLISALIGVSLLVWLFLLLSFSS